MRACSALLLTLLLTAPAMAAEADAASKAPILTSKPTAEDFARFYPALAQRYEIDGQAVVTCNVRPDGRGDCKAQGETPPGLGFGRAAEKVAATFRFAPGTEGGVPTEKPWTSRITSSWATRWRPPPRPPTACRPRR